MSNHILPEAVGSGLVVQDSLLTGEGEMCVSPAWMCNKDAVLVPRTPYKENKHLAAFCLEKVRKTQLTAISRFWSVRHITQ